MSTEDQVKAVLSDVLQIGPRAGGWTAATSLIGGVPELDSMAVAGVIAGLEQHFGFAIQDDEINADVFGTLGSLTQFVDQKLGHA